MIEILGRTVRALKSKEGQTLVEYALIIAFISIVTISVLISFGHGLGGLWSNIETGLTSAEGFH